MRQQAYGYAALAVFCLGISPVALAELKPISDAAMGEVTGQGFMQVENLTVDEHNFTRLTLGMDVQTRVNIDDIRLGQTGDGADFAATHVALGHISRDGSELQYDGQTYAEGTDVPFEGYQPYIELAEDSAEGSLSGFRMGFAQARGSVSSLTTRFSGHIGLKLTDDGGTMHDATLFDAAGVATGNRATQIGIDDGSGNCGQCAPLEQLQSLIVGTDNGDGTTGYTDGFFIGFQREDVDWQALDGGNAIRAGQGVFINLPTSMTIDMSQLVTEGVPRLRTHQADLGPRLF